MATLPHAFCHSAHDQVRLPEKLECAAAEPSTSSQKYVYKESRRSATLKSVQRLRVKVLQTRCLGQFVMMMMMMVPCSDRGSAWSPWRLFDCTIIALYFQIAVRGSDTLFSLGLSKKNLVSNDPMGWLVCSRNGSKLKYVSACPMWPQSCTIYEITHVISRPLVCSNITCLPGLKRGSGHYGSPPAVHESYCTVLVSLGIQNYICCNAWLIFRSSAIAARAAPCPLLPRRPGLLVLSLLSRTAGVHIMFSMPKPVTFWAKADSRTCNTFQHSEQRISCQSHEHTICGTFGH